jgi:hypothetical protein
MLAALCARFSFGRPRLVRGAILVSVLPLLIVLSGSAYMQAKKPISKEGLLKAIRLNGLSTAELVQNIQQRGVEFQVTSSVEHEMRDAGAQPEVIQAARLNFRPYNAGPAGGEGRRRRPAVRSGPTYDDLYDQATTAVSAQDGTRATQLLQEAIRIDGSQPRAFGLLGFAQLYLQGNISAAETSIRAAIDRGGSGVFRVYHDHTGNFTTNCRGSLFVTRSNVTFRADDGVHTFGSVGTNIKRIGTNSIYGSNYGAFHIELKEPTAGKKLYNFAPYTKHKAESELIVELVKSYQHVGK